jgi:hypothetical protein
MDLLNMLADLRLEINVLRQLEAYLQTDEFRKYKDGLKDTTELEFLVKTRDIQTIKRRVSNSRPLDEKTIKELRVIASGLKIRDYHLKSKDKLIGEIEQCRMVEQQLYQSKSFMHV